MPFLNCLTDLNLVCFLCRCFDGNKRDRLTRQVLKRKSACSTRTALLLQLEGRGPALRWHHLCWKDTQEGYISACVVFMINTTTRVHESSTQRKHRLYVLNWEIFIDGGVFFFFQPTTTGCEAGQGKSSFCLRLQPQLQLQLLAGLGTRKHFACCRCKTYTDIINLCSKVRESLSSSEENRRWTNSTLIRNPREENGFLRSLTSCSNIWRGLQQIFASTSAEHTGG